MLPKGGYGFYARRHPTMCVVQGRRCHATPDVVLPSGHSKGGDVMPRPTSYERACSQRAVMSCHARRRLTICASQGRCWHATTDIIRSCVLPNGDDGIQLPTSFDGVCFPKVMMACHARSRSIVCAIQRQRCHVTSDVVPPCVVPKGDDGMPHPTLFDCVCCRKAVMSCHA